MEDIAEIERRDKQMYLKSEIMEGGYDVDVFVTYMDNIRENGKIFFTNSSPRWNRRRCMDNEGTARSNPLYPYHIKRKSSGSRLSMSLLRDNKKSRKITLPKKSPEWRKANLVRLLL